MIKSLNKNDILVTPFTAQKNWEVNTFDPSDLILWQSQSYNIDGTTSSYSGSVSFTYIDYGDNNPNVYPITNSYCNIATQQQDLANITHQQGVFNTGVFYPTSSFSFQTDSQNPKNLDGTYMSLVYEQNKHLFYNNYNNFTQIFGANSADLSLTNRNITSTMDVFTIPPSRIADGILPNTVVITDKSLDKTYQIIDDGNSNLIFSGSLFSSYEINNLLHSLNQNLQVTLSSFDVTGSVSNTISQMLYNFGVKTIGIVSSSLINTAISGGIPPYTYNWYIGGDYMDYWKLDSANRPSNTITYKNFISPDFSDLYFTNTYVVCVVFDAMNTQAVSNVIYLTNGVYTPPTEPVNPLPPVNVFPEIPPSTNIILHLANTGINTTLVSGNKIDKNYYLHNFIPDSRIPNDSIPNLNPYSSSYVGSESSLWFSTNSNVADWIGPISPVNLSTNYANTYAGTFVYRTYFDLVTPTDIPISPSGFTLSGSWATDSSASISINGNSTGISLNDVENFSNKYSFNITGGFVSGRNYIDFYVYNIFAENTVNSVIQNPVGLYVEFDSNNLLIATHYPPSIIHQSSDTTVLLGNPFSLFVNTTGDNPISYQWYQNNQPIIGATSNIYSKPFSVSGDTGMYVVSASNAYGSVSSHPKTITIL